MATRLHHTDHHRREALVNRHRFTILNAVLVGLLAVASYWAYQSARADYPAVLSGQVRTNDGYGIPNVTINLCNGQSFNITYTSNGSWSSYAAVNSGYCARVSNLPAGWGPPQAINNNPDVGAQPSYEFQIAGSSSCYHNPGCAPENAAWDRSVDSGIDMVVPAPRSTIRGRVYDSRTGTGISGVRIELCFNHSAVTGGDGNWSFAGLPALAGFCARSGLVVPSGWTGPTVNNNPGIASGSYEYQVAGYNCYHACAGHSSNDWDKAGGSDSGYNFAYTSPPPPKPQPKPTPQTNPTPGPTLSGSTSDTQPPTDPTNLVVKYENQEVKLNWTASTDNSVGLKYQIERSLDNSTWSVLSSEVTDTNYSDRSAAFEVKYFYRVKAIDAAGNASGYITVEFTTPKFKANLTEDSTTIESDDGLAKAIVPKSAVEGEVACGLVIDSENRDKISQKLFVAAGPYRLRCQKASGDEITSFKQPVTILVTVPKDATKDYTKFKVLSFKDNWTQTKTKYAKKTRQFSFTTNEPIQFVVVGEKRKGIAGIVSVLLLVIVAGGGFFFFRLRRAQKQSYNEYLRKKYYDL